MILITVFDKVTGEVIRTAGASSMEHLDLYDDPEVVVFHVGGYDYEEAYLHNDEIIFKPPKPSYFHCWDEQEKVWKENITVIKDNVISKRNSLLLESDWTDTLSFKNRVGESKYNEWQVYRQALRDITTQEGFPITVVWPVAPT